MAWALGQARVLQAMADAAEENEAPAGTLALAMSTLTAQIEAVREAALERLPEA